MPLGPIDLAGRSCMVLCFDPDLQPVPLANPGRLALISDNPVELPCLPECVISLRQFARGSELGRLRALRPVEAIVHTTRSMGPRAILAAASAGARWFHLVDGRGSSFTVNARGALALAARRRMGRVLARFPGATALSERMGITLELPWPNLDATLRFSRWVVDQAHGPIIPVPAALRIAHYVGHLGPGGAERQLVYLALAQQQRGHSVEVVTTHALAGHDAHYSESLAQGGVPHRATGAYEHHTVQERLRRNELRSLLGDEGRRLLLEHVQAENLLPLLERLQADTPHVLHCWLDESNCLGALAGLLAGVPRVLVSTRNLNPEHFPRFHQPWFRDTYRALAGSPRVTFIANSRAGADDYAAWSGVPRERFHVVWNGFDASGLGRASAEERRKRREALGLDPAAFLLVGVFRLASEKRPLEFLQVVSRLRAHCPGLQVVHVGVGELESEVRAEIDRLNLTHTVRLLGRLADPWRVLGLADASLLTSEAEGCPNASLESQALGVPIVLTDAGGAAETVDEGKTGFACPVGDVQGLADRLITLVRDPGRRAAMGEAGPTWITRRFSMQAMIEAHLLLYGLSAS